MTRGNRALVAALFAAHMLLHAGLGLGREAPDLAVVAVLAGSRLLAVRWGAALGFLVGLGEDSVSMAAFGSNTLALTLAGAGGSWSREVFLGDSLPFTAVFLFVGKWLRDLLAWLVTEAGRQPFTKHLLIDTSIDALYVAAAGVALFVIFPYARTMALPERS